MSTRDDQSPVTRVALTAKDRQWLRELYAEVDRILLSVGTGPRRRARAAAARRNVQIIRCVAANPCLPLTRIVERVDGATVANIRHLIRGFHLRGIKAVFPKAPGRQADMELRCDLRLLCETVPELTVDELREAMESRGHRLNLRQLRRHARALGIALDY